MTITNRAELDKCRESAEKQLNAYNCRILVCSGTGCIATGSEKIYKKMLGIAEGAPVLPLNLDHMMRKNMWA